jgi:hypothetical protein
VGFFAEGFEGIGATVMGGNHAEAGGTAVHGVVLDVGGEFFYFSYQLRDNFRLF